MERGYTLHYQGKKSAQEILRSVRPLPLKPIAFFGEGNLFADAWRNKLIYGDNLIAMRTLLDDISVRGHVRLVYIDPPFATLQTFRAGSERTSTISASHSDALAYQDTLAGPHYLEFLRERLIFLHALLADNGSIYVHIGDEIVHLVRLLMDEVFGADRFVNHVIRIKCNPKNFQRKAYGNIKDHILFYTKSSRYVWNNSLEEYTMADIMRLFPKVERDGRRYTTNPLHAPGETRNGPTGQPWRGLLPPKGRHWRYPPEVLEELDKKGLIEWSSAGNPRKKIYADEYIMKRKKRQDIWEFKDPPYPAYPTEKNMNMLETIIEASSDEGDIVLDCFVGSGTTLVAAERLGRRWIGIDNSPKAIEIALTRLMTIKSLSPVVLYALEGSSLEILQEILQKQSRHHQGIIRYPL